jgi:hypothetical protein
MADDKTPPLLPPESEVTSGKPEPGKPQAGQQWMVKHPSINGQWQPAMIAANPGDPSQLFVQFADGTAFSLNSVELGGPLAALTDEPAGETAAVSPLLQPYEDFRQSLVKLNEMSRSLFQLPLNVLIIMVTRYANTQESEAHGVVATFGGDISTFVPDQPTFDKWLENYLLEIQRRETAGQSAE